MEIEKSILLSIGNDITATKDKKDLLHKITHQLEQLFSFNDVVLSLSNAIATIRNKTDLFEVINDHLKKIFSFEDFVICLVNEDNETHSAFLYNENEDFQKSPGIAPVDHAKYTLDDGLSRMMMAAEQPIVFNVADVLKWPDAPAWLEFWYKQGIKEMTGLPIVEEGSCIGFFFLYSREFNTVSSHYYNLLRSVGLQVSVAISNIKAIDKIEQQLKEIDAYKMQLEEEKIYLRQQIETTHNYGEIIGSSPSMQQVFHLVNQVATSDSTVLILGETGTGKELIARAIHNSSSRKDKLMIKINCATLPTHLIESELFGHEKGSFTGATERRIGKFELANNGTLFLDEIGELALDLQVKLLRVLQEKEIERIGGKGVIKINVRIIAATNRVLAKEVQEGTFRSDLFYRLNVYPILVPPLREHKEDISPLAFHFTRRYAQKAGKNVKNIAQSVIKRFMAYNWPGNIRELEHLIERSVLLTNGVTITEIQLPKLEKGLYQDPDEVQIKSIYENERDHILSILKLCAGKISGIGGAAELLDIPPTTLNSKIKKFNIKREHMILK